MGEEEVGPRTTYVGGGRLGCTIGTPSTRLSLVGLRPRRARLRFTRRRKRNDKTAEEQDEGQKKVLSDRR